MEEISVNGENFIKASILAKNFGYTPDYIGQLCRSKQVKCTLVGRSWYVNEDSLREHRKGRYRSSSAKSKEYLRKMVTTKSSVDLQTKETSIFKYENDEKELFPTVSKQESTPGFKNAEDGGIKENLNDFTTVGISYLKSKENYPVINQSRHVSPVLRTIPALRPKTGLLPTKSKILPEKGELKPNKASPIVTFAIFMAILMTEGLLLFGALGLEKRLVMADNNQAMVLYSFDANKTINTVISALER